MTDRDRMIRILTDIKYLTDQKCLETIKNEVDECRERLAQKEIATWNIGDDVQLLPKHQNRKPYGVVGKLKKINSIKVKIDFGDKIWTVPKTMIMKV